MPPVDSPGTLTALCAAFVVLVHLGFRAFDRRRALTGIPTSAAAGVHIGLNRVEGTARPIEDPLVSPVSATECAGWSWRVEDEWRKDSIWRWRRRARWRLVSEETAGGDFDLVDETGDIRVRPAGSTITGFATYRQTLVQGDPDYLSVAPASELVGATGRRRVTELIIPITRPTTIIGTARLREDIARPELAWDSTDRTLLLSSVGLAVNAAREVAIGTWLVLAAIAALAIAPLTIRPSDTEYWRAVDQSGSWVPILVVGGLLVLASYWLKYVYNDLVRLRERVSRARSLVGVELQRRHDLLPALADVVAAASDHEHELLVDRTRGRDLEHATVRELANVDQADAKAASQITAVAEASPSLEASESYRELHTSIVGTEDRLALARAFYNDSVTLYNDRRSELPTSLVARLFRFAPAPLYDSGLANGPSESSGATRS